MPIKLTERRRERLTAYLREQFSQARSGRKQHTDRIRTYIARYEAKTQPKNFPFKGASSIHVPLIAEFYDSIKSRIMNALKAQPDAFIDVSPLTEEPIGQLIDPATGAPLTWRTVAELFEEYLLYEIGPSGEINLIDAVDEFLDDILLTGTGWLMPVWATESAWDYPPDGSRPVERTVFDNVRYLVPSIEDIFYPPHYDSLARIPWWSRRYLARPSEIMSRVPQGFDATAVREFLSQYRSSQAPAADLEMERAMAAGIADPSHYTTGELQLAETWMRFVLDSPNGEGAIEQDDRFYGREVRILVDHAFEDPSHIFRITTWPYVHGKIPAAVARYIRRRGRMDGMGIPERLESLDEAMSSVVNMLIDNGTIANTRLWRVRANSEAAEELTEIWPNKAIPVEEPSDLEALQAGEIYPSGFELHNIIRDHAERVSKVTDYNLGRESAALGRQSTATATLALLSETGQHHDNTTRNVRTAINDGLNQTMILIAQHKPLERVRQVLGARGDILIAALTLDPADLGKRIGIQVSFSSTAATRELQRQEEQAKAQFIQGYYQFLLALATQRFGDQIQIPPAQPQMSVLIDAIAKDANLRMRKMLEAYGERSSTSLLPSWQEVLNADKLVKALSATAGAGANGNPALGAVGPAGTAGPSGMGQAPGPVSNTPQ